MALINKLTSIADSIRSNTGKSGGLTLTAMATEIQDFSITRLFEIEESAGADTTLISANDLIKAHRAYNSLFVAVIPLFSSASTGLKCLIATNHEVKSDSYGVIFRVLSNSSTNTGAVNKAVTNSESTYVYVDPDGAVIYKGSSPLLPGAYLIVCGWSAAESGGGTT